MGYGMIVEGGKGQGGGDRLRLGLGGRKAEVGPPSLLTSRTREELGRV